MAKYRGTIVASKLAKATVDKALALGYVIIISNKKIKGS